MASEVSASVRSVASSESSESATSRSCSERASRRSGSVAGSSSRSDSGSSGTGPSTVFSVPASSCSAPAATGGSESKTNAKQIEMASRAARAHARAQRKAARAARKLERVRAAAERARVAASLGSSLQGRHGGSGGLGSQRSKARGSVSSSVRLAKHVAAVAWKEAAATASRRAAAGQSMSLGALEPGESDGVFARWGVRSSGGESESLYGDDAISEGLPGDHLGLMDSGARAAGMAGGGDADGGGAASVSTGGAGAFGLQDGTVPGPLSSIPAIDGRTTRSLRKSAVRRAKLLERDSASAYAGGITSG